jgi:membrane protein DedA with SNARE-associated domain
MLHSIVDFVLNLVWDLGYIWIFVMMTLESSFFPFPSEVAMIPAWALAHSWEMNFWLALLAWILGSLFWAYINYLIWMKFWTPFIEKFWKYFFLKTENYNKAENYFKNHWAITTFTGRLIPVIRQYISFPAGVFSMNIPKFLFLTGLGAGLWSLVLMLIWYVAMWNKELISTYGHYALIWALLFVITVWIIYFSLYKIKLWKKKEV